MDDLNEVFEIDIKKIDDLKLKKMIFIYNALEKGWTITKNNEKYIFKKKHNGEKEVFLDSYLTRFMIDNFKL